MPHDVSRATRQIKQAIRHRIDAGGTTVVDVVAEIEDFIQAEVSDIEAARARGDDVWPVIEFDDVAAGTVSAESLALLKRRGCALIRRTFDPDRARQWDREIVDYVDGNHFFEHYRGPGDDYFGSVDSQPEIYPVYWSSPQMEARQDPRMAVVQQFLNSQWKAESEGRVWFDPDRDVLYPDRIRRRPPGTTSKGLGAHLDPGTLDLWMSESYQRAFRHVFAGDFASYDPWDAAHRTDATQYPGSTMCSAFRTFQGWTALSDVAMDGGVLHSVPIPKAMAHLLLRPLLEDVDDDDLCGVRPDHAFPVHERWHALFSRAFSPIPAVHPGDTVWWHCDLIHSVSPVHDQRGWANVMYIPAAPWCPKNARYASAVREAFEAGHSPPDFPAEHYEAEWPNRFRPDQLSDIGRRALGFD